MLTNSDKLKLARINKLLGHNVPGYLLTEVDDMLEWSYNHRYLFKTPSDTLTTSTASRYIDFYFPNAGSIKQRIEELDEHYFLDVGANI